jgi:hypothetical protein
MLGCDGNTVEELRELIAVPLRIEWVLRAYAKGCSEKNSVLPWLIHLRTPEG